MPCPDLHLETIARLFEIIFPDIEEILSTDLLASLSKS